MMIFNFFQLRQVYHHLPSNFFREICIAELICLLLILVLSCFIRKGSQRKIKFLRLLFACSNAIGVLTFIVSMDGFLTILANIGFHAPGTPIGPVIGEALHEVEACGLYLIFFLLLVLLISFYLWIRIWFSQNIEIRSVDDKSYTAPQKPDNR